MVAMAGAGTVLMPAHLSDDIAASRRTVPASAPQLRQFDRGRDAHRPAALGGRRAHRARRDSTRHQVADGRLDDAAKMLGLSRKGLYLKRQRLNLD